MSVKKWVLCMNVVWNYRQNVQSVVLLDENWWCICNAKVALWSKTQHVGHFDHFLTISFSHGNISIIRQIQIQLYVCIVSLLCGINVVFLVCCYDFFDLFLLPLLLSITIHFLFVSLSDLVFSSEERMAHLAVT